jgi:hypothetical protein
LSWWHQLGREPTAQQRRRHCQSPTRCYQGWSAGGIWRPTAAVHPKGEALFQNRHFGAAFFEDWTKASLSYRWGETATSAKVGFKSLPFSGNDVELHGYLSDNAELSRRYEQGASAHHLGQSDRPRTGAFRCWCRSKTTLPHHSPKITLLENLTTIESNE